MTEDLMAAETAARQMAVVLNAARHMQKGESFKSIRLVSAFPTSARWEPPEKYIREKLGWTPWQGDAQHPGQVEILQAYTLALRQQHEREKYEQGESFDESIWRSGQVIQNRIRVESGDNNGKTRIAAGIVRHFFDHFEHSVIYTFAPSARQVRDLLWKFIKIDAQGRNLPGRVLDTCILKDESRADHFAVGIATDNSAGLGRERIQGQHAPYTLIVIDEAPGVADYVYDALANLTSGGIVIVIMLGNPTTATTRFHFEGEREDCISFRMDTAWHPNVLADRELIPGAATRRFVLNMIREHCETVDEHQPDNNTFSLAWEPNIIYKPDIEYLNHVMGIPALEVSDRTVIPLGRFRAAVARQIEDDNPTQARFGLDVARFGGDAGTLYSRIGRNVRCLARFQQQNSIHYYQRIKSIALDLPDTITSLHIRVDAGGGENSGGIIDNLNADEELKERFPDYQIIPCHFGGNPQDEIHFRNAVTEWMIDVAESLKGISVVDPPKRLESDLCKREYDYVNWQGRQVKVIEDKPSFRKRVGRSPDDGDGFVLAVASDFLFSNITPPSIVISLEQSSIWSGGSIDPILGR